MAARGGSWMVTSHGATGSPDFSQIVEQLEDRSLLSAWIAEGPGPSQNGQVEGILNQEVVGAVHAVAAHPSDADTLYIGTANGGIWKTTNATSASPTWSPLTDNNESLSIGALEFDPTDGTNQTLVAGVGNYSSFAGIGGPKAGLLRTTDGGATWTPLDGGGTLDGKNINGVAARGSTITVSVNFADSFSPNDAGIFRSIDTGATFTQISNGNGAVTGLPGGATFDVAGDPSNANTLYTAVVSADFFGGLNGIYKSVNGGANWSKISNAAMDALIISDTTNNIEIDVGNSNNVYVGIINFGQLAGLFRSGDGGGSFTQLDTPVTNEDGTDVGINPRPRRNGTPGGQGATHFSIVADPTNANVVYVGGDRQPRTFGDAGSFPNSLGANDFSGRLFRVDASLAMGSQAVALTHVNTTSNSAPHADSRDMVFDAIGNLIEVDDGGIYRRTTPSMNTGDWFSVIGNLQNAEQHDLAYDTLSNILISGNQDTGTTFQLAEDGTTWFSLHTGDGGDVAVDNFTLAGSNQSIRYTSFQNLGAFRRTVWDAAGALVSTDFPNLTVIGGGAAFEPQFVTPIALNVVDSQRLVFVGSNSVYESLNQGETITEINDGGIFTGGFLEESVAYGHATNADVIYVGVESDVLLRTTAGGTLTETATQFPGSTVSDLVLDSVAADDQSVFVADDNSVFITTDAGGGWTDITGNLAALGALAFETLVFVPGTVGNAIVLGTQTGVYFATSANFMSWSELGTGLPNAIVHDLVYDAADNVLAAGTLGRGAWTLSNATGELGIGSPNPPVLNLDFGDAPDPTYPTLLVNDGARHVAIGPRLGSARDFELDGQPNATATGDDIATALSTYAASAATFSFEDISSTGTIVSLDDDVFSSLIALPFNFDFFGSLKTDLFICSNGFLSFSGDSPSLSPTSIPNANTPNDFIAGWWNDLNPAAGGSITFQTLGDPGSRRFIVQFTAIPHFREGNPVTFQFKLFEGSNNIEVHYLSVPSDGDLHVAGVENAAGNVGVQFFQGNSSLPSNSAVLYTPAPLSDEGGVTFLSSLLASPSAATTASVAIDLQNANPTSNLLDAWLDLNHDGDWDDLNEQILVSFNLGTTNGRQVVQFTIPRDTGTNVEAGTTFARFRLSTGGELLPTGFAGNGEVEDYQVTITQTGGTNTVDLLPGNTILDLFNGNVRVRDAVTGAVISSVPITETTNLVFNGAANDDDTLTLDFSTGNPLPAGGLTFNGGADGNDKLTVIGDNRDDSVNYTPGSVNGSGTLSFNDGTNSRTITFTGLEPVDITAMASVTVSGSSGADLYTLTNGVDATMGGANAAFVVSGTRNGVTIESAHIFNVDSLTIDTGAGNDKLTVDFSNGNPPPPGIVNFNGGAGGNDKLAVIGDAIDDSVNYTPGLVTGSGTLTNNDGTNNRTLTFTGLEPVDITGMASVTVSGSSGADNYTLSNGVDTTMTGLIPAIVVSGTRSGVTIESAHVFNVGSLTIDTGAGNDTISASAINRAVVLNGGAGNDTLTGGTGNDTLSGGAGKDSLNGGAGIDTVAETTANDVMMLTNTQLTGNGTDRLTNIERALLSGTAGNETLDASAFTLGNVTLLGGAGNDTLIGGAFTGAADGDELNDSLDGGAGVDVARQFSSAMLQDFTADTNVVRGAGNDRWTLIEGLHFIGIGNAKMKLDALEFIGSVTLSGGTGDDELIGGSRNNVLNGNAGNDTLTGGNTADMLSGGAGNDSLVGNGGSDLLNGQAGSDTLRGNAGDDHLIGEAGNDKLFGGSGNDLMDGGAGSDVLTGESGDDSINGGEGSDAISGGDGNDFLNGGLGNDTILGGSGADVLRSGGGSDRLAGGSGDDRFVASGSRISLGGGNDTVSGSGNTIDALFTFDFERLLV